MKHLLLVCTCLTVAVLSAAAALAAPISGLYYSTDQGGGLLLGRYASSRTCLHLCGGVGDVFLAQSWNGTALGTQWYLSCPQEAAAYSVNDKRVAGTGAVDYTAYFSGGTFNLAPGPWGSGSGTLGTTLIITTVQYVNFGSGSVPVASRSNIQSAGTFAGGNCALQFFQANGTGMGDSDWLGSSSKPSTYPGLLDASCGATRIYGNWGDVTQITLLIYCPTPARAPTWGSIRRLYR